MATKAQVPEFYAGKTIFITGATGFIGKVLLWKVLHSCPLIDTLYLLIREKRGKSSADRLTDLLNGPIFVDLWQENPSVFEKVIAIRGDVSELELGLSTADRQLLVENVSIVFHGAANLQMNANLREAVRMNTEGTHILLSLASEMRNLQSFVYVSTAFCCCDNKVIEEKVYGLKDDVDGVRCLVRCLKTEILNKIAPELIRPLPNSYIYSKRLTKIQLLKYESKLPIQVARPTIVIPSLKEPAPGFIDNFNDPIGMSVAFSKGVARSFLCPPQNIVEVVPVDIVCNGLIVIPWAESKHANWFCTFHFAEQYSSFGSPFQLVNAGRFSYCRQERNIPVYNLSFVDAHSITWGEYQAIGLKIVWQEPFEKMLWYPQQHALTSNRFAHKLAVIFYHFLPAYTIDFILKLLGKKPFLVKIHKKISERVSVFEYFVMNQWIFKNDNIHRVEQLMNEADRQIFQILSGQLDNQQLVINSIRWVKKYLLKEKRSDPVVCRRRLFMFYVASWIFNIIFYIVLARLFLYIFRMYF